MKALVSFIVNVDRKDIEELENSSDFTQDEIVQQVMIQTIEGCEILRVKVLTIAISLFGRD